VGDSVKTYDELTGEITSSMVLELDSPIQDGYYVIEFDDESQINVTSNHPFYTLEKGWAAINPYDEKYSNLNPSQLDIGNHIMKSDGNWKQIIGWVEIKGEIQTYNLKNVEGTHTFFAGDSLVHNKC